MSTITRTITPELVYSNIASSVDLLNAFTDYTNVIGDLTSQLSIAIDYWTALVDCDNTNALTNFFIDLDNNKFPNLDNEYIFFWVKKYQTQTSTIVNLISTQNNASLSFFDPVSDCIGLLANLQNKLDESVIPIFDIECKAYGVPVMSPVGLNNKLSTTTTAVMSALSYKTTALYRTNIQQIQQVSDNINNITDSTKPHGLNLITDYNFYVRYASIVSQLVLSLHAEFETLYNYINYFSNINDQTAYNPRNLTVNVQAMNNLEYQMTVEGFNENVDFLQKRVQDSQSLLTIKRVLSVDPKTVAVAPVTTSINNQFLANQAGSSSSQTALPTPASASPQALASKASAASKITSQQAIASKIPVQAPLAPIIPKAPTSLPSVDPTILNTAQAGIGAFSVAKNGNASPTQILSEANAAKGIFCNFKLPNINLPNFGSLLNPNIDLNKLKSSAPKFPKVDFGKILKSLVPDFGAIFKSFYAKLFDCKNNKD